MGKNEIQRLIEIYKKIMNIMDSRVAGTVAISVIANTELVYGDKVEMTSTKLTLNGEVLCERENNSTTGLSIKF